MKKILFVMTSHEQLSDTEHKTGVWLEEAVNPYYTFIDAGFEVTLTSPKGREPPIDPKSTLDESQTEATRRFFIDEIAQERFKILFLLHKPKLLIMMPFFCPEVMVRCGISVKNNS
ncbi:MAG: hypothetical protein QNJ32_16900 [Xenococcaceae cyanobacterium MO_167.B27]|nr:hypothetical protein [Xenococcaceae cyanobacterium MO_167.B27]